MIDVTLSKRGVAESTTPLYSEALAASVEWRKHRRVNVLQKIA